MWQTWGTPGSCRPQFGPMLAPINLAIREGTRKWKYHRQQYDNWCKHANKSSVQAVSLTTFCPHSNSMETSPCCNYNAGHQIATNICTCHASTAGLETKQLLENYETTTNLERSSEQNLDDFVKETIQTNKVYDILTFILHLETDTTFYTPYSATWICLYQTW